MKRNLLFILVALLSLVASAYDAEIDGLYYNLSEGNAVVTRDDLHESNLYSGNVSIPESITYNGKTYPVTGIDGSAFGNCRNLTSVTIPESVTNIGNGAFQGCRALNSVIIPKGVTEIDQNVFMNCTSLKSVSIPEGVTSIGIAAFSNCSSLESIIIPNAVTSIGNIAFANCRSLTSITIPEGITSIGYGTFSKCSGLTSVIIPNSVTRIGGEAFENCSSLTSVNIPDGVTSIDDEAFYGCNSLTDVYCYAKEPPSVKTQVEYEVWDGYPFNPYFIKEHTTLHVPASSLEKYKTALRWSDFWKIVAIEEIAQEYFPEGTKWTEIRLDTLKFNNWYSKVGDEWVPNFETIEYYVQGEFLDRYDNVPLKCVYSNGPEWSDSLTLLVRERMYDNTIEVNVPLFYEDSWGTLLEFPCSSEIYQFDWSDGKGLYYRDIMESNSTGEYPYYFFFGVIKEIKEGDFGGVRPLKYVDLDGKAPDNTYEYWDWGYTDTRGGRIIQGIGITEWNDGECLFGPPNPYFAFNSVISRTYPYEYEYEERHYRSMLVHFERDGEVLYDVWPEKGTTGISATLNGKSSNGKWYDLQGRKLSGKPARGIYIENGKKVLR